MTAPLSRTSIPVSLTRWTAQDVSGCDDWVAAEEPLELRVEGKSLAVVMRTPGHDRELAAGFLLTEGIIQGRGDLLDLVHCISGGEPQPNILEALLDARVPVDWARLQRHTFASSSCGVCGKASIDAVRTTCRPLTVAFVPARSVLQSLPDRLRAAQAGFAVTGGLHASGLFTADGDLLVVREDVGRHNALDKVTGWAFFAEKLPLEQAILLVSGRVSFELMQKALAAGISCVAAVSAPTSLAVEFARESGQTLVGFLRGDRMNVYAGTIQG
ncbi:MAG TPA: formate dehydrogenase accessory sulfurtransferase FdhD [Opitutaceae bacterium]|nr:formate dehydrogenase accessory sulfurtransferase FdhD [Opitutaceae bacterium]